MQKRLLTLNSKSMPSDGFTLVELLIVLTIVAVLAIATVLILNPGEILKKSRDTQRISDLNSMKSAIALYLTTFATPIVGSSTDANCKDASVASTRRIWLSMPNDGTQGSSSGGWIVDTSPPSSWSGSPTWVQGSTTNLGKVDGTGWIPINLNNTTGGAAISNWPQDPNIGFASALTDITNSDRFYRYTCNGASASTFPSTFEINANLESSYYTTAPTNAETNDGGDNSNLLEAGTYLYLLPSTSDF